MKKRKGLKITLIVLGVIIVLSAIGRCGGSDDTLRVTIEEAETRDIVEIVTTNGRVRPVTEVKMAPDVSGEIVQLYVEEGEYVERGQMLARINPDIYESALDRAEASLNQARANLANARARVLQSEAQYVNARSNYLRNKRLFEENAISESEYETAYSQYRVAEAEVEGSKQNVVGAEYQVKSAEAGVRESRDNLSKTNLFAPMDGTVSRLDAEVGERVVGTQQYAGTEIIRIANLNAMEVIVDVNENDIIRVNEGDTAFIQVDAFFGEEFQGLVTSIANSADTDMMGSDQVTNFEVRIRILTESYSHLLREDRPHLSPFRPGMSATVDIQTERATNVVSLPIQAVTTRDADIVPSEEDDDQPTGGSSMARQREVVFLYEEGKVRMVPVRSGIQDNQYIQIREGLEAGQQVVTGPYRLISRELADGMEAERVERAELFR